MTSQRIFYGMIALNVALVLAIIAGAILANQQLQIQSRKLVDYKESSQVLQQEQVSLTKAKSDVATYSQLQKIARIIVPQDKDQAQAVREIINIAAESGIKPTAINFPASTLGGSAGNTSPTSSSATKQSLLSQLTPVKGIKGVYSLQITISQNAASPVPYDKFIDFIRRLEQNRRTAQVSSIVLQPSAIDRDRVSFTLTVDEYIKP